MSRLTTPTTIENAPTASQPILEAVKRKLGVVPNLFKVVSNSPAALEGYVALSEALGKGTLPAATHERIALAVAEANGCSYCLSAHSYLAKNLAKLNESEIRANRDGSSEEPAAAAAVGFAVKLVRGRGHIGDADLRALRAVGYDDAQIVEIVLHVALNTWTNYLNEVAKTAIDFPVVTPRLELKLA
jgi:uncharacterized peroxidase-related enzyme